MRLSLCVLTLITWWTLQRLYIYLGYSFTTHVKQQYITLIQDHQRRLSLVLHSSSPATYNIKQESVDREKERGRVNGNTWKNYNSSNQSSHSAAHLRRHTHSCMHTNPGALSFADFDVVAGDHFFQPETAILPDQLCSARQDVGEGQCRQDVGEGQCRQDVGEGQCRQWGLWTSVVIIGWQHWWWWWRCGFWWWQRGCWRLRGWTWFMHLFDPIKAVHALKHAPPAMAACMSSMEEFCRACWQGRTRS